VSNHYIGSRYLAMLPWPEWTLTTNMAEIQTNRSASEAENRTRFHYAFLALYGWLFIRTIVFLKRSLSLA
jgi:hypothetical protein